MCVCVREREREREERERRERGHITTCIPALPARHDFNLQSHMYI